MKLCMYASDVCWPTLALQGTQVALGAHGTG